MFYPANFPIDKEEKYLNLLMALERDINPKQKIAPAIQAILKKRTGNLPEQTPPLWHLKFTLERYKDQFSPKFYEQTNSQLKKTKVRSWSGIVPVSIFTGGVGCPFNCVYCANEPEMPKSYFSDEPAVRRAIRHQFDPYQQTFSRLQMLYLSGHSVDKIELIIQGGTFSFYDQEYREWFVKRAFDAANCDIEEIIRTGRVLHQESENLEKAQRINETGRQRIVGLTIETRPDFINPEEVLFLRKLGVTRIEMGVQAPDEQILKLINRGHGLREIVEATQLLKDTGFKITYHLMPGLPGSTPQHDLKMLQDIFTNPNYMPDNIKFYPTSVVKHSQLAEQYKEGKYQPYNEKDLTDLVVSFKQKIVPPWTRIQRLVRDLTVNDMVIDSFPSNLRQKIEAKMKEEGVKCPCIRCREIKLETKAKELHLETLKYQASQGQEFFLQYVDKENRLYGLLRLRLTHHSPLPVLQNAALIRELHIYGEAVEIGQKGQAKAQHHGLGKKLIKEAEKIAQNQGYKKMAIIAAIGTREYYRKHGYCPEQTYMVKQIA